MPRIETIGRTYGLDDTHQLNLEFENQTARPEILRRADHIGLSIREASDHALELLGTPIPWHIPKKFMMELAGGSGSFFPEESEPKLRFINWEDWPEAAALKPVVHDPWHLCMELGLLPPDEDQDLYNHYHSSPPNIDVPHFIPQLPKSQPPEEPVQPVEPEVEHITESERVKKFVFTLTCAEIVAEYASAYAKEYEKQFGQSNVWPDARSVQQMILKDDPINKGLLAEDSFQEIITLYSKINVRRFFNQVRDRRQHEQYGPQVLSSPTRKSLLTEQYPNLKLKWSDWHE